MRKFALLILVVLAAASVAMAQITVPTPTWGGDELGAHNCYGRGCVACHAPHGGATGNNVAPSVSAGNGGVALWGQDVSPYYGATFNFAGATNSSGAYTYAVTLPSAMANVSISDTNSIVLLCLSCHDGNVARVGMMQNSTVETLPIVGGHAPTLFGLTPGNSGYNYNNEHPVGPNANVSCGGSYSWDCVGGGQSLQPIEPATGGKMWTFLSNNLSSFWNGVTYTPCNPAGPNCPAWGYNTSHNPLSTTAGVTVNAVTCTTCHNQHDMIVYQVGGRTFSTMFFIKGYYNPASGGNNVAQFCRNCHGGNSNEMAGIMNVPTT